MYSDISKKFKRSIKMDILKNTAAAACFLGIVFSVADSLNPSEKMSKQLRMICSLILVLVTVPMITSADVELPDFGSISPAEDHSGAADRYLMGKIEGNICDRLGELLAENKIFPVSISVSVNNTAPDSISITEAEVILADGSDCTAAEKLLRDVLGNDVILKISTKE